MSPSSPEPRLRLGNDVVDLDAPRVRGKASDERFLRRILHDSERSLVDAADDREAELWSLWAAKESGYKVVSKLEGVPPPFVHERFVVSWEAGGAGGTGSARAGAHGSESSAGESGQGARGRRGWVRWGDRRVQVEVDVHADVVHAVACGGRDADTLRALDVPLDTHLEEDPERSRRRGLDHIRRTLVRLDSDAAPWTLPEVDLLAALSEREREAVHSRASAAVRIGAKADLAETLGLGRDRLEIVCGPGPRGRRPPRVLLDGAPAALDVSLSHHGAWIAWALFGPERLPGPSLSDPTTVDSGG